ncbi:hypothetical protein L6164_010068 [Bauhinia variegata]|uniref:Uncharacterized protein n=1 Tax=Bauhinia variegata TaxID=167791 RepID=A0ACB9PLS2_BAUVA|nr:hypothetical protein L6164_010068 [Bauhinia variegata]
MAIRNKVVLAMLFFSLLALSAYSYLGTQEPDVDPELITCNHQCQQQQQYSEEEKRICEERCEEYQRMKKERQKEIEEEARRKKEREHHQRQDEGSDEEGGEEESREKENPFVFQDKHFETRVETDDGRVWVLQKFTKKSELLRGIENFRLVILEANGHTFVSPCHFDSEVVFVVVKGRATIGLVKEEGTERFNLQPGDIMRVPAGATVFMVNRDEREKLFIAKFHMPVSIPGEFEAFYGPGGEDPESFLTAFSWEILQAAYKTQRHKLQRLFEGQKKGSMFNVSREHVEALSKRTMSPGIWPFGRQWRGPFNLLSNGPSVSNEYGRLFEMSPDKQTQFQDINLLITWVNITNGSMTAPLYNSLATNVALVIDGKGDFEMACPHISFSSEGRSSSATYQRVSARLRPGVVFVVPAGHPFVTVASTNTNLQIICFEVNARGNKRIALAGKKNVVKAMDDRVKELAFNFPAKLVQRIFNRDEQFFFPGPCTFEEREELGRAYA